MTKCEPVLLCKILLRLRKSPTVVCWVRNTPKDQLSCSVSETEFQKRFPFGVDNKWKISVENYISIMFISIFLKWKWYSPEISVLPFKVLFWWMFESTMAYRKMLETVCATPWQNPSLLPAFALHVSRGMIFVTKQSEEPHCQQTAGRHQMLFTDGKTKELGSHGSGIDAYKGSIGNPDVEETLQ